MTDTEVKFQRWAKKNFSKAYVKKLPDYKTGAQGRGGWPDYILINNGVTEWYEVKSGFGDTINLKHFTAAQLSEFPKIINAGGTVLIYCFTKSKGEQILDFKDFMETKKYKFL